MLRWLMPSKLTSNSRNIVLNAIALIISLRTAPKQKTVKGPKANGASQKPVGFSEWKGKDSILYTHSARAVAEIKSGGEVKGKKLKGVPYLNPDSFQC